MTTDTVAPLSQVETDSFCDCGYNLHGQLVWRDERLELLVCRCPECGRHAAAGRFTGIHSTWLHRLSLGLIIFWVVSLIQVFLFLTIMSGVWPGVYVDNFIHHAPVPNTGPAPTLYVYDLRDLSDWDRRQWGLFTATMYGLSALNGLVAGAIGSTCMWHLRRGVYLLLLLPIAAIGFVVVIWANVDMTSAAALWVYGHLLSFFIVECATITFGIVVGRPMARFVLQLLLPNRLLQHLAFLWYRDDKALPPMQKS